MGRIVKDEQLKNYIMSDLKLVQVPTDFELVFREYSQTLYGTYKPKKNTVTVYLNKTKEGLRFSYEELLEVALHEAVHHYQHKHQEGYTRLKGVMHDPKFNAYYEEKIDKLIKLGVM